MKVLYAIQATGNGHLARAQEILPQLSEHVQLDVLTSGTEGDLNPGYPIKYKLKGFSYAFGKNGGVNLIASAIKNNFYRFTREIMSLPVKEYDLIINDFEPVSAWAAKLRGVPCVSLSHQYSLLSPNCPMPKNLPFFHMWILKYYAPVKTGYGFHFKNYDDNIFSPIIRSIVQQKKPISNPHFTVYLPTYSDDKLHEILSQVEVPWQVFSRNVTSDIKRDNVSFFPVDNERFCESMASSTGVLCGAGFETPTEALFLNKKLAVIPMKNQFEQRCNAFAMEELGIPVFSDLNKDSVEGLNHWINNPERINVDYSKNKVSDVIARVLTDFANTHIMENQDQAEIKLV